MTHTFTGIRRVTAWFFASLFLFTLLLGIIPALGGQQQVFGATATGEIIQDSNVGCKAVVTGPSDGYLSIFNGSSFDQVTYPDSARSTFAEISQRKNMVYITFVGENTGNTPACRSTMVLVQSPDSDTAFHGFWYGPTTNGSAQISEDFYYASAAVNPAAKTIRFTIDQLEKPNKTFDLNLTEQPAGLLSDQTHFSTGSPGGGEVTTGVCSSLGNISAANESCLEGFSASFADAATISFAGETYTATFWGGDNMRYSLSASPDVDRASKNIGTADCTPYFELNTDGNSGIDMNIDGDGGTGEIRGFIEGLNEGASNGSHELKYQHYDFSCNDLEINKSVSTVSLKRFARYYPATDEIRIVFSDGGSNEKRYIQNYARTGPLEFTAVNAAFSQCDASKPKFVFSSDPKDATALATAQWRLVNNACEYLDSTVNVIIAAADTIPTDLSAIDDGTDTETDTSCEGGGLDLGWIVCPIIRVLDNGINFLDNQVQSLLIVPEDDFENEDLRGLWSVMRNIALLILVPIMLIMVMGTALGFDFVDAYTVKKALPRVFIAVIFISLSWEITTFMIEVTNTVGKGVLGLVTSPLNNGNDFSLRSLFDPSGATAATQPLIFAALIGGVYAGFVWGPLTFGVLGLFAATIFLGLLTAFLILMLRQIIILALMLLAPLAILSWIFPGNDKIWKLWWGGFTKLLIMFPLIMLLLGSGRMFAQVASLSQDSLLGVFMKLTAYIAPYFFIPATFKFAGGIFASVSGMVNDRERGLFDRMKKGRQEQMSKSWGRKGKGQLIGARADLQNRWQKNSSKGGLRGRAYGLAAKGIGGYNIQALDAAQRAVQGKELNDQIATGRDDEIRALTVNKAWALRQRQATRNADGSWNNDGEWRDNNGVREFKTLGGAWVNEGAVDAGHKRWGNDTYAQQAALSYEMRKASTEDELQHLAKNYNHVATDAWKMSTNQAGGAWIGAAFENQNQHLEFKNTNWETGGFEDKKNDPAKARENARKFVTEVYEKKGSYQMGQMSSYTIEQLKQAYDIGDTDMKEKIGGIAETFMSEFASGGVRPGASPDDLVVDPATGATGRRQARTPGAAHVAERVRELAELANVYRDGPSGPYTDPNHAPTPNNREQT